MGDVQAEYDDGLPEKRSASNPALAVWRLMVFAAWTAYCHCAHLTARYTTRDPAERRRRAV